MDPPIRATIRDVDLVKLSEQFRGSEYRQLVQQHVRKMSTMLESAITAATQACTDSERGVAERLIDKYNHMGYDQSFWHRDTADVLNEICSCFDMLMSDTGARVDNKGKFNIFQLITMNFALQARDQKALRKFAGIRKSFIFR